MSVSGVLLGRGGARRWSARWSRCRRCGCAACTWRSPPWPSAVFLLDHGPARQSPSTSSAGSHVLAVPQRRTWSCPPLKVGPLDLADQTTFLAWSRSCSRVLGVGLVALRNSGYGRRLAAMKDSPAASAMLGQNLVRLKLSRLHDLRGDRRARRRPDVDRAGLGRRTDHFVILSEPVAGDAHGRGGGIGYVSGALVRRPAGRASASHRAGRHLQRAWPRARTVHRHVSGFLGHLVARRAPP